MLNLMAAVLEDALRCLGYTAYSHVAADAMNAGGEVHRGIEVR